MKLLYILISGPGSQASHPNHCRVFILIPIYRLDDRIILRRAVFGLPRPGRRVDEDEDDDVAGRS